MNDDGILYYGCYRCGIEVAPESVEWVRNEPFCAECAEYERRKPE
jgi:hypothetical protein